MTNNDSNRPLSEKYPPEFATSAGEGATAPAVDQPASEAALSDVTSNMANCLPKDSAEEAAILEAMQRRFDRVAERTEEARRNTQGERGEVFAKVEAALANLAQQAAGDAGPDRPAPVAKAAPDHAALTNADELTPSQNAEATPEATWTSASAEQLTRHYEQAGFEFAKADPPVQSEPATSLDADEALASSLPANEASPSTEPAITPSEPATSYAQGTQPEPQPEVQPEPLTSPALAPMADASSSEVVYVGGERPAPSETWFAERFAELATRLDAATVGDGSDASLAPLLERLTGLETRLDTALAGRSDEAGASAGGSLHDIELCIAEIARQLETTNAEVARIADIEKQITDFTRRIAGNEDDGIPALFDPGSIADLVAEHMASRPVALVAGDATSYGDLEAAGIGELTVMMKDFMAERRTEGEHANAVLDTMQQTIMRLLDRMDSLEGAHRAAPASNAAWVAQPPAAAPAQQNQHAAAGEPELDAGSHDDEMPAAAFGRRGATADEVEAETVDATSDKEAHSLERLRLFVQELDDEPAANQAKNAQQQQRDRRPNAPRPVAAPAGATAGRPRRGPRKPLDPVAERGRFIEAARAAAEKAGQRVKQARPEPASDDDGGAPKLAIPEMLRRAGRAGKSAVGSPTRTRLLIAALAILVVGLGATKLATGMKLSLPGFGQSAVTERIAAPTPAEKKVVADTTMPGPIAAPVAPATADAPAVRSVPVRDLVQSAALDPNETTVTNPAASDPVSGVSRKQLPSAMVGPLSLRLAAANGEASAQFEVAARFAEGRGVQQDFEEAVKWYQRSASSGFALSQYRLGTLYERGLGVEKDIQRARVWYERAAAKGNIKAMHNLAVLAAGSAVGKPDYTKAARWFTAAAEHGLGDSQFNLAILYQHGMGVQQDDQQAYQWFSLAAIAGDAEAGKRKAGVAELLGKAKAAELDQRVAEWHRRPVDKVANDPHVAGQQWQRNS